MTPSASVPHTGRRLGDVAAVAERLAVSKRHVLRLCDAGRLPRPIRLGRLVRWDLDAIDEWIAAGCPRVERRGDR